MISRLDDNLSSMSWYQSIHYRYHRLESESRDCHRQSTENSWDRNYTAQNQFCWWKQSRYSFHQRSLLFYHQVQFAINRDFEDSETRMTCQRRFINSSWKELRKETSAEETKNQRLLFHSVIWRLIERKINDSSHDQKNMTSTRQAYQLSWSESSIKVSTWRRI